MRDAATAMMWAEARKRQGACMQAQAAIDAFFADPSTKSLSHSMWDAQFGELVTKFTAATDAFHRVVMTLQQHTFQQETEDGQCG